MRSLDDLLAASKWASALSAGQLQRARTTTIVRELGPGNYACHKGDPSNVWIGVIDGLIKMANLSETGRSVTFATFSANCWFGEGSILKQEPRKYDVVALRGSRVALMPAVTFFWLLDTSISFNRFIMNQLNERLGQFVSAFAKMPRKRRSRATLTSGSVYRRRQTDHLLLHATPDPYWQGLKGFFRH
jgi:CRP/FNR family transcriptional regulator, cyclic AMP receptor protein